MHGASGLSISTGWLRTSINTLLDFSQFIPICLLLGTLVMIAIKEVTVWKDVTRQPNHVYLMVGEKAVAYIKWGEGDPFYFKNPMRLDKRYRKFVELKDSPFNTQVKSELIEVKGSKGNTYFVDPEANTCTCPGFTFRGACKHTKEAV
jgi:hypothetical protein